MKYIFYILFISLFLEKVEAQNKIWSVDECMMYALEHHPDCQRQNAQNKIYQYNHQEAIAGLLPSLGVSSSLNANFGRGLDGKTNTYTDVNTLSNNYNMESGMVLFAGQSKLTQVKIQKVSKLMGKNQLEQIKDDIAYQVMSIFYNVVYYKKTIYLAQKQYEARTEQLKQIKRMEEIGLSSATDVAEFEAQQAADKLLLIRQQNLYAVETIRLKEKMNYPFDLDFEISDSTYTDPIRYEQENTSDIYQQSLMHLPKVLIAKNKESIQQLQHRQSIGRLFPSISIFGGMSTSFFRFMDGSEYMPFSEQLRERRGQYVGISMNIPIFQNLSRLSEKRRAKQQLKMVRSENELILREIHSEIEQATTDVNGLAEEYMQAQKQLKAKEIAHKQNTRKYEEGLISALELNISANRLLEASIDCYKAMYQFQVKHRLVNYYKGESFIQ